LLAQLRGIIAAKIDRLTPFARRIVDGLARLLRQQAENFRVMLFIKTSDPVKAIGAVNGLSLTP